MAGRTVRLTRLFRAAQGRPKPDLSRNDWRAFKTAFERLTARERATVKVSDVRPMLAAERKRSPLAHPGRW